MMLYGCYYFALSYIFCNFRTQPRTTLVRPLANIKIRFMKNRILLAVTLSVLVLFASYLAQAQTPLTTATLDITLQCSGGTANRTGIAFNPNQQLYYSVNAGNTSYPIETFDNSGIQVSTISQGFDYRGAWWNPNTGVLEGNGHANLGIWIQDVDASFYALGTGTNAISGVSGPDSQSSANYDSNTDEILYYFNGSIYRYDRATHNLITTSVITGLPVPISNLNSNSVAYTGVIGFEIGVYDYINKAFHFINKTTGAYVMTCQLPATAPAAATFKMGFANGRLWLYNQGTSQWESYITVEQCAETLANITETSCFSYTVPSGNQTYTNSGIYNDTLVNTNGCDSIITIDLTVNTIDISVTQSAITLTANFSGAGYQWLNCDDNYAMISGEVNQSFTAVANGTYAVEITLNGCVDTSICYSITTVSVTKNDFGKNLFVYPNPTDGHFDINLGVNHQSIMIIITDLKGKVIQSKTYNERQSLNLKIEEPAGVYLLNIESGDKKAGIRLVKK